MTSTNLCSDVLEDAITSALLSKCMVCHVLRLDMISGSGGGCGCCRKICRSCFSVIYRQGASVMPSLTTTVYDGTLGHWFSTIQSHLAHPSLPSDAPGMSWNVYAEDMDGNTPADIERASDVWNKRIPSAIRSARLDTRCPNCRGSMSMKRNTNGESMMLPWMALNKLAVKAMPALDLQRSFIDPNSGFYRCVHAGCRSEPCSTERAAMRHLLSCTMPIPLFENPLRCPLAGCRRPKFEVALGTDARKHPSWERCVAAGWRRHLETECTSLVSCPTCGLSVPHQDIAVHMLSMCIGSPSEVSAVDTPAVVEAPKDTQYPRILPSHPCTAWFYVDEDATVISDWAMREQTGAVHDLIAEGKVQLVTTRIRTDTEHSPLPGDWGAWVFELVAYPDLS
jgi:hypothetical protein